MRIFIITICIFLVAACESKRSCGAECHTLDMEKYVVLAVSSDADENRNAHSLSQAVEQAKLLLLKNTPVVIELEAGVYYLESPIVLGRHYSGTEQNPFIIRSRIPGAGTLSGGKQLKLDWQKHDERVYKANVSTEIFDDLYVNGEKQIRARYPNYDPSVLVFNGHSADAIDPQRIKDWANPIGGFVHSLHEGRWGGMHHQIVGQETDGELILDGGFQNNRRSEMHEKYRYVENIFEELDAPGEWFYNKESGELYFYPLEGVNLSEAHIVVSNLDHLIEVRGALDQPVANITIEGLEFAHTAQTFMKTDEPLLRSDWSIYRGGAVVIEGAENVSVKNSKFHFLGGNAILVSNYNRDISISGNHIYDIGASAVSFIGDANAVRSPSFEYNESVSIDEMDFTPGPKTNNHPSNSVVHDNLIYDIGTVEKQVAGVQLSMASAIRVSHNSIYRVPRSGINVSEGTWGGHIIEHNDVFDTVLETGDHGAFNSWGRDRFWHPDRAVMDALAEQHPEMWKLDAQTPVIIRNNRFQCDHGWDIDLDDGSSNYEIYNNVALNGGIKLREGFHRIVENNIVLNNSFHPHVWFKDSQDVFKKNILLASHKPILNEHWGSEIDYNFFANQSDLEKAQSLGLDANSVAGEPEFIEPASGNYQLKKGSIGLELGFKNFPMDQFGVVSPHLKVLAETPNIPDLFLGAGSKQIGKTYQLLGATLKSVETVGEQSALGIPEIAGAMILFVKPESKMELSGLRVGDVILNVIDTQFGGSDEIVTVNDLLASYQSRKWRGVLEITISRNQKLQNLVINVLD